MKPGVGREGCPALQEQYAGENWKFLPFLSSNEQQPELFSLVPCCL